MKPAQVRMGRAALKWSLNELAVAAGVHRNTITNFENGRYAGSEEALSAIRSALERAGIEFIPDGVRLKPDMNFFVLDVADKARRLEMIEAGFDPDDDGDLRHWLDIRSPQP